MTIDGFVTNAPTDGTIEVTLPQLGLRLVANFADSKGRRHSIKAETRALLNAVARHTSVEGTLLRGKMDVGTVDLKVDWGLLKKALPSLA